VADRPSDGKPQSQSGQDLTSHSSVTLEEDEIRLRIQQELKDVIPSIGGLNGQLIQKVSEAAFRAVRAESFRGPLPHPSHLGGYDSVLPGAAERILTMTEEEQRHRHRWENRSLTLEFCYSVLGLFAGAVAAIGLIVGAYFTAEHGHDAVAVGFLAASAASMVSTFVRGRSMLAGDKSDKSDDKPQPRSNVPATKKSGNTPGKKRR
jgi:uncharacterized membrane protein